MSSLEEIVYLFLKKKNIKFIMQKHFDFMGRKSLDFFLPKYNAAIECQGAQHYTNKNLFFNSKKQIKRDLEKLNECNKNGIKIYYFTNYDNKKNIPHIYRKNTFFNLRKMLKRIEDEKIQ